MEQKMAALIGEKNETEMDNARQKLRVPKAQIEVYLEQKMVAQIGEKRLGHCSLTRS